MTRKAVLPTAAILLGSLFYAQGAQGAQEEESMRSVQSGVYTQEQAERGGKVFSEVCISCHELAEFEGGAYLESWSGQTAHDLIEHIRETMPQDNPGSLPRKDYVDVTAYFFQLNGLPAGETEMETGTVKTIRIEGPFPAKPAP
jgi:mono/diheme cytochrome c family protein